MSACPPLQEPALAKKDITLKVSKLRSAKTASFVNKANNRLIKVQHNAVLGLLHAEGIHVSDRGTMDFPCLADEFQTIAHGTYLM